MIPRLEVRKCEIGRAGMGRRELPKLERTDCGGPGGRRLIADSTRTVSFLIHRKYLPVPVVQEAGVIQSQ